MSIECMSCMTAESEFSVSEYDFPPSEVDVEFESLLETALSSLAVTANGEPFSDLDTDASTALSASASCYSLPESETEVVLPQMCAVGEVRVMDSLYCLDRLSDAFLVPVSFGPGYLDINNDDEETTANSEPFSVSEYEMPPSEAEVTMAGL